jgi:hypothetical protein
VSEDSAAIGLSEEAVVPLNGNHMEICKYKSEDDENYITVSAHISRINRELLSPEQNL